MTTVQIVGIAVASAVVVILVIALLVTRDRSSRAEEPPRPAGGSFLDEAPQDSLARLGRAEQPVEDVTHDPAAGGTSHPPAQDDHVEARAAVDVVTREKSRLGLDWGPQNGDLRRDATPSSGSPTARETRSDMPDDTRSDADTPGVTPTPSGLPSSLVTESGSTAATPAPAQPAEGGSTAGERAVSESGAGGPLVPLSEIIFTTSNKLVDLQDPEVRRMLTDLVKLEIDQATQFRRQGQTIDAVLQLTEAEKISRALNLRESAQRIHEMIEDLHNQM
jgi:hypothetical protein